MSRFKFADGWERLFILVIVVKGIDGVLELVGGVLLLFVSPDRIHHLVGVLTQHELSEDPRDFVASQLLHSSSALTDGAVFFAAAYLLVHGLVKVVLVAALLRGKLWAYPWMISVLVVFIVYQIYQIILAPTIGLIALTVFDILIVALTVREYRYKRPSPSF